MRKIKPTSVLIGKIPIVINRYEARLLIQFSDLSVYEISSLNLRSKLIGIEGELKSLLNTPITRCECSICLDSDSFQVPSTITNYDINGILLNWSCISFNGECSDLFEIIPPPQPNYRRIKL